MELPVVLLGNYNRPTNRLTDRLTDRRIHREVSLQIKENEMGKILFNLYLQKFASFCKYQHLHNFGEISILWVKLCLADSLLFWCGAMNIKVRRNN